MSKISFIIATKNRSSVILDTLKSLLNQTIEDWEAIIINDHGTDNTLEIINQLNDRRFRYYNLPDDHGFGLCCARNYGIILAQSNIVAILDSDDIAYPNRVKITLETFNNNSDMTVFYANLDIWDFKKNIIRERKTPVCPFAMEIFKKINFIPHSTVAIKKSILLDNPYNPFFKIAEDYDLLSRLSMQGKKFIYSKEKVLKYRLWNENISSAVSNEIDQYTLLVKMLRGWIPFDENVLNQIDKIASH